MDENRSKTILIVDDDEDVLNYLTDILKKYKFEVISTPHGAEVLNLAIKHQPDLIILDVVLPDMLGGEVSRRLSHQISTAKIPIIFLSGLNTKEDEEIARKAGNYFILAKPVTKEELLTAINRVLQGKDPR